MQRTIAVRFEGGLGDHVLGMRVLPFLRDRFPEHRILGYCDCGGFRSQLAVARLCPDLDDVIPIFQDRARVSEETIGALENLQPESLARMRESDIFVDTWPGPLYVPGSRDISSGSLFLDASTILDVPFLRILSTPPRVLLPDEEIIAACQSLDKIGNFQFIALNLEKYSPDFVRSAIDLLKPRLLRLLRNPKVCVLNIYSRDLEFPHLANDGAACRFRWAQANADLLSEISDWHDRIVPLENVSVTRLAAIFKQCRYFLGVDNGLKHLAWAIGLRMTFFLPFRPSHEFVLRWVPNYERLCIVDGDTAHLDAVVSEIEQSLG